MIIERPYNDVSDLEKMRRLVAEARGEIGHAHYLHTGDLVWQLQHMHAAENPADLAQLWEDERGELLGFALIYRQYGWFELQVKPALRGELEAALLNWVERQGSSLYALVNERDDQRRALLEESGFARGDVWHYLERSLTALIPALELPDGFVVRSIRDESEAEARATLLANAFGGVPDADKYRRYMQSSFYDAALDLVAASPDGTLAAFAQVWVDPISRQGQFEPVGTAPEFRRLGLGRALLLEGLRLMQARGMERAFVVVEGAEEAAVQLYQSVGLQPVWNLYTYGK